MPLRFKRLCVNRWPFGLISLALLILLVVHVVDDDLNPDLRVKALAITLAKQ